jgi:hypothetical protein
MRAVILHICHNKVSLCSEILACFLFPFSFHQPLPAMFLQLENDQIPCNALLFADMFMQLPRDSMAENETLVSVFSIPFTLDKLMHLESFHSAAFSEIARR